MTSVADAKTRLRAQVRSRRRGRAAGLDPGDRPALAAAREAASLAVAEAAAPLLAGPGRACIAAYEAMAGEPPTKALIAAALDAGVRVLVPELLADRDLDWRRLGGPGVGGPGAGGRGVGGLGAGGRGVGGPGAGGRGAIERGPLLGRDTLAEAGVVFVPALLVDRAGRRLGQGGGSYDRSLPRCSAGALVVAVVHDQELVAGPLPVADHDARVGAVITPGGGLLPLG